MTLEQDIKLSSEAFKDATVSTREKGETDETAGWSFSDETYTATLDWKEK